MFVRRELLHGTFISYNKSSQGSCFHAHIYYLEMKWQKIAYIFNFYFFYFYFSISNTNSPSNVKQYTLELELELE